MDWLQQGIWLSATWVNNQVSRKNKLVETSEALCKNWWYSGRHGCWSIMIDWEILTSREESCKGAYYHHYCLSLLWFLCQQYWTIQAMAIKYQKHLLGYYTHFTWMIQRYGEKNPSEMESLLNIVQTYKIWHTGWTFAKIFGVTADTCSSSRSCNSRKTTPPPLYTILEVRSVESEKVPPHWSPYMSRH